ncbi:oxygen-independent coproporphyrinogen III oxidase [Fluviibacter phosphoraccumulans]|mgnify:FL=1|uniref:oxygen-independent coproporphyrinogen III oxidase n=1 Tax=Fluviibacter phosphoraccumulans TaxID=1751046 RepID=UPI00138A0FAA|nr:oxygen-independent coproporphyrinogen III oxidase [Fluviibacter phosphoraccumulans]
MNNSTLALVDRDLCRRFDISGPRYTSYPTADRFQANPGAQLLVDALQERPTPEQQLSLYVHLPFCSTVCYYCGCNKVITKDHQKSSRYLDYLEREIDLQLQSLIGSRSVAQLHWGGGTPTFLSDDEMRRLMGILRSRFDFLPEGEYSIEIDPRSVDPQRAHLLAEMGFNRMSLGIQDFDPLVQQAVNRIQTFEQTRDVLLAARDAGFKSVSVDLIYGLPRQTLAGFRATLEKTLSLAPDRIALYSYAHLPQIFMPQRRIHDAELPQAEDKLSLMAMAIETLVEAGYVFIGMDHFARPDDELALAQQDAKLHRNFQGYSTHAELDLLAFGVSAIAKVGPVYAQNAKTLDEYYGDLDAGHLPVRRGYRMNDDDALRRIVIQELMCHFELDFAQIEQTWSIDFRTYFASALEQLQPLAEAGLLTIDTAGITVEPKGRLLVRIIAMAFDYYLQKDRQNDPVGRSRYSRVI